MGGWSSFVVRPLCHGPARKGFSLYAGRCRPIARMGSSMWGKAGFSLAMA